MRSALPALSAFVVLAGCVESDGMVGAEPIGTMAAGDDVFLVAEDATFRGEFTFSFHGLPADELPTPLCQAPTECHSYDIPVVAQDAAGNVLEDVETKATMALDATLLWASPATALDLYLLRDGTEVAQSTSWSLGTDLQPHAQQISLDVGPGDYQLMVVGYHVVMDAYDLAVTFEFHPAEPEGPA